jgi:hypothetical protein
MKKEDTSSDDVLKAVMDVIREELNVTIGEGEVNLLPDVIRKALREGKTLREAAWRKKTYAG